MDGTQPVIGSFLGTNRFLSNFWPAEVRLDGETYPTVEHAYQAAKVEYHDVRQVYFPGKGIGYRRWRDDIRTAGSASRARTLGRSPQLPLRDGWDEGLRLEVMRGLLLQKFRLGHALLTRLLATGDAELVEGNWWHDTYFGRCTCPKCPPGENHLGKLLMEIRALRIEELRQR